jgi:hypothetical protein
MGSLMRALGKGVASAASGISERAGKQLDSQLEETRRKRLAEYAIAAEDKAYSKGQERRKAELSDPNSAWSMEQKLIKENAGMETITDAEGNVLQRRKGSSDAYTQAQVNRDGLLTGVKSGTKKPTDKKYNFGGVELTAPQLFKAFESQNKAASEKGEPTQTFPEFMKSITGGGDQVTLRQARPELIDAWRKANPNGTQEDFIAEAASKGYDASGLTWDEPTELPTKDESPIQSKDEPKSSLGYDKVKDLLSDKFSWGGVFGSHQSRMASDQNERVDGVKKVLSNWNQLSSDMSPQEKSDIIMSMKEVADKVGDATLMARIKRLESN